MRWPADIDRRAAVTAWARPLPLRRTKRGMQPPDLGAVAADDRRPISVISLRIRLEESDAILAFVDRLVDCPPVAIMGPPIPGGSRRGAGSENKASKQEKCAPHRHSRSPLNAVDHSRSGAPKETRHPRRVAFNGRACAASLRLLRRLTCGEASGELAAPERLGTFRPRQHLTADLCNVPSLQPKGRACQAKAPRGL
jgi:hypothetical protein